jgi:hypothetical protein
VLEHHVKNKLNEQCIGFIFWRTGLHDLSVLGKKEFLSRSGDCVQLWTKAQV